MASRRQRRAAAVGLVQRCSSPTASQGSPTPARQLQLTENVVGPVPPVGTVTVRGFAPLTAQLLGTSLSDTW
ncbi:MAG TPA: hypothetical protein VEK85_14520 [Gemmatimonadales bacterium]|nr:hypothetical protein [Gemmatimonadales bacterium]